MKKRFVSEETIAVDDEEFLSQAAAAAETFALSASTTNAAQTIAKRLKPFSPPKLEGAYVDALRGADVFPPSSRNAGTRAVVTGGGGGSSDVCFKCGKVGHWSRDCDSVEMVAGGGGAAVVETKPCVCGAGDCLVLTANTDRNRGRKFFRCPVRQENGGCTFFEWCDGGNVTASRGNTSTSYDNNGFSSQFPALPCPCGAGSCLILTAKTANNAGQQFYRCPASQGSSCGFFKCCHDQTTAAGKSVNLNRSYNSFNDSSGKSELARNTSSCFKCGQEGHWARDCSESATEFSRSGMKPLARNTSSCFKCGQEGHWARDCSESATEFSRSGMKPSTTSSIESCYKCGKTGHWAKDCPGNSVGSWQRH